MADLDGDDNSVVTGTKSATIRSERVSPTPHHDYEQQLENEDGDDRDSGNGDGGDSGDGGGGGDEDDVE